MDDTADHTAPAAGQVFIALAATGNTGDAVVAVGSCEEFALELMARHCSRRVGAILYVECAHDQHFVERWTIDDRHHDRVVIGRRELQQLALRLG